MARKTETAADGAPMLAPAVDGSEMPAGGGPAVGTVSNPAVGEQIVDVGGWVRNTTAGDLTVMGAPSMTIPAGDVGFLPYTPSHYGLEPADAPAPDPEPSADGTPEPADTTVADPAPPVKE